VQKTRAPARPPVTADTREDALAVGILLDATVIRALIVPAAIALMGDRN
jgi:hypothetical protein